MTWPGQCSPIAARARDRSLPLVFLALVAGCYLSHEAGPGGGPSDGGGASETGELPETAIVQLAAGGRHTCVLQKAGRVRCWGDDDSGQLGDGTPSDGPVPVDVEGLNDAAMVAAGEKRTCAVRRSGRVVCWGAGWVGDGTKVDRHAPVPVAGLTDAVAVGVDVPSCAVRSSGPVVCWGGNQYGELGDGTTTNRTCPVEVRGLADATAVSPGNLFACALRRAGRVVCWGSNGRGELGDGSDPWGSRLTPVEVAALTDATGVSAGGWHACALRASGRVVCWGGNPDGRLGNGKTAREQPTPVEVKGLRDAVAVTAGGEHTCALRRTGQVVCWGKNHAGQLGDGSTKNRKAPVHVAGLDEATAVSAGGAHTCALRPAGDVVCWGSNIDGRLGDGTDASFRTTPVRVRGL